MSGEVEKYNPSDETVVIYRSADSAVQLDVQLADETVWLTQAQIALLFQKAKSTISYHITNIFKEGELDEKVVVRKIRITTPHGAMSDKTHKWTNPSHDRWLIIDDYLFHCGHSLKDMGRKMSAITKMGVDPEVILNYIK
jgi:hypothetical protein